MSCPVVGWMFSHFQGFPIKRDSADRAALRRIEALLKAGEPVVLFPEGRLSESGRLQRVQPGAALLSLRTGVPIIPVGLQKHQRHRALRSALASVLAAPRPSGLRRSIVPSRLR